jgi:hypothetical protein
MDLANMRELGVRNLIAYCRERVGARFRERPGSCSSLTPLRPSDALRGTSGWRSMQSNNGFLLAAIAVAAIAVLASLLLIGDGRFPFPLWR